MEGIPPQIAMEMALARQNVAVSVMKQAAQADRAIANILANAVANVPVSGRGGIVNTSA